MLVSYPSVLALLESISKTSLEDQIACEDCFAIIAEFADRARDGLPLTDSMRLVEEHLQQCPCCRYEYKLLLESLSESDPPSVETP